MDETCLSFLMHFLAAHSQTLKSDFQRSDRFLTNKTNLSSPELCYMLWQEQNHQPRGATSEGVKFLIWGCLQFGSSHDFRSFTTRCQLHSFVTSLTLQSMYNQQLLKSSAQLSGGQLLLGDTWEQLHPNCYTQLFRLRHFYQRFWLHHHKNILRQIEQKHTWTHAENHSVHLHTQRDTSTAEAVFTKQQTQCSVILAMLEKSNSAPNHEDLHFLYKVPSLQQIPLLTDSNYLPWMGETFRKSFPSNQCLLILKEQNP